MSVPIDLSMILVVVTIVIVTIAVLLSIHLFGMKEKTYEEAIAEQKRMSQEMALQTKTEKPSKEKKKKHLKKVKDKSERSVESEEDVMDVNGSNVPSSVEIFEPKVLKINVDKTKALPPKKVNNVENKENMAAKDATNKKLVSTCLMESKNNEINLKQKKDKKEEKEEIEEEIGLASANKRKTNEATAKVEKSKSKTNQVTNKKEDDVKAKQNKNASSKGPKSKAESDTVKPDPKSIVSTKVTANADLPTQKKEKEDVNVKIVKAEESKKDEAQVQTTVVSPSKRNKKKELGGDNVLSGILKEAILSDAEIQTLIEILLNRQQEGESWVKPGQKIDPLFMLKKQLQEKEQALADEQQLSQTASTKLKEVRQEVTRYAQKERFLQERINSQTQEIQNLQFTLQHSKDQCESDVTSVKMEFQHKQSKLEKDHRLSLQIKDEENDKLKCALSQSEENKNMLESELSQLQLDLDQWRGSADQLQAQNSSLQQSISELEQHVCQLQQELEDAKNQDNQHMGELLNRLKQLETDNGSLQMSLQSSQTECNSLHAKLMNFEKNNTNCNQSLKELETQLRASDDKYNQCCLELEKRKMEIVRLMEQLQKETQLHVSQKKELTEEVNKKDILVTQLQEEVKNKSNTLLRLNEDVDIQRRKNNDLREKNWKAVEALSSAEKRAEEKIIQADKRSLEMVSEAIEKEHVLVRGVLERVLPNLPSNDLNFHDWLQSIEKETVVTVSNDAADSELLKQVNEAQEKESALNAQIVHYQGILADTESMLNKLQKSVEAEEENWKQRLYLKEEEMQKLKDENKCLEEQKASLENNLEQIKAAEEMQEKLKELKGKLQLEEKEKRALELRFKEAQKTSIEIHKQLEDNNKELESLRKEHMQDNLQRQALDNDLEKEKKLNKDLSAQNVKLNSLVRIGQDSLKAEQDKVTQLTKELSEQKKSATNGSTGPEVEIEVNPSKK